MSHLAALVLALRILARAHRRLGPNPAARDRPAGPARGVCREREARRRHAQGDPGGTTFTVPAGWTMTTKGSMVVLDPPEPDSHLAIVDVKAKDADAAVAAGWAAYKPDFKRPLKISLPSGAARRLGGAQGLPVRDVAERAGAVQRATPGAPGEVWTVMLIDGTEPTFEKRGGPISLRLQSLRPKGYARESFAGKKAHPLDAKRLATLKEFVAGGDEDARHARRRASPSSTAGRSSGRAASA